MAEPSMTTGKIVRLYVAQESTYIRLDNAPASGPAENYFKLRNNTPNYNALYSLALASAANRWPLTIRIEGDAAVNSAQEAFISYLFVDWSAPQPPTPHRRDHRTQDPGKVV